MNPTILRALPGYYNSAYGLTATVAPCRRFYVSLGGYNGNVARGEHTGLQLAPTFNGYRFQIGETDTVWLLGPDNRRRKARSHGTGLTESAPSHRSGCGAGRGMATREANRDSCNWAPTTRGL